MKLTKQQQVLGGIMLVGLIAVGVDRLMPKAGAANTASVNASDLVVAATATTPPVVVARASTFNLRLASAVTVNQTTRSAFEVGPAWQSAAQATVATIDPAVDAFSNAHHLTATLARAEHSGAVVDGKLLTTGQTLDGFRLISVTGRAATFSNGHSRVTLNQIPR